MSELSDRLRKRKHPVVFTNDKGRQYQWPDRLCDEAANHIDALEAENARLREALEEIATGRDKNGEITDFPRERASAALGVEGEDP